MFSRQTYNIRKRYWFRIEKPNERTEWISGDFGRININAINFTLLTCWCIKGYIFGNRLYNPFGSFSTTTATATASWCQFIEKSQTFHLANGENNSLIAIKLLRLFQYSIAALHHYGPDVQIIHWFRLFYWMNEWAID